MKTYQEALQDPKFWIWVNFCMTSDGFLSEYERLKGPSRTTKKLEKRVFDEFTKFCFYLWARLPDEII